MTHLFIILTTISIQWITTLNFFFSIYLEWKNNMDLTNIINSEIYWLGGRGRDSKCTHRIIHQITQFSMIQENFTIYGWSTEYSFWWNYKKNSLKIFWRWDLMTPKNFKNIFINYLGKNHYWHFVNTSTRKVQKLQKHNRPLCGLTPR